MDASSAFPQPSHVPFDLSLPTQVDAAERISSEDASIRAGAGDEQKLAAGREILSTLGTQEYKQRWKSSGPLPRAPVWGEGSWRGDKQPKQMIGTTNAVSIYELQRFLKPSDDPASAAAFPVVPKTPASELKVHPQFFQSCRSAEGAKRH